jgi:hypothetical protein
MLYGRPKTVSIDQKEDRSLHFPPMKRPSQFPKAVLRQKQIVSMSQGAAQYSDLFAVNGPICLVK